MTYHRPTPASGWARKSGRGYGSMPGVRFVDAGTDAHGNVIYHIVWDGLPFGTNTEKIEDRDSPTKRELKHRRELAERDNEYELLKERHEMELEALRQVQDKPRRVIEAEIAEWLLEFEGDQYKMVAQALLNATKGNTE